MKGFQVASALLLGAMLSVSGHSRAEDEATAQCAKAYEQGQEQRKSGQLMAARSTLQSCSRDECPDFVRTDCANWYGEVQNELPTLVFTARSAGRDLADVRVSTRGRVLTSRLDGQGVELDPGEYDIVFEEPEMQKLEQHFVVARGERNRLIQVELTPLRTQPAPRLPPPAPTHRSLLLPGIFAGVGALGVAGFATLGAWGHSRENELKRGCRPDCTDDQIASVKTKYVLADVSLGVGVASLALGAYLLLRPSESAPPLAVVAGPQSAAVVYGGAF